PCKALSSIVPDSAALPGVEAKSLSTVVGRFGKVMDNLGTALTIVAAPIIIYDIVNTCQTGSTQDCVLAVASLVLGAAAEVGCTIVGGPALGFVCGFAVGFLVSAGPLFVENLKKAFTRSWNEILKEAADGNWGEVAKESVVLLFSLQVAFLDTARQVLGEQAQQFAELGKTIGGAIADGAQTAAGAVADAGQTAVDAVADAGQTAAGAVADGAQTAAGAVADAGQTAVGAVADGAQTAAGAVADAGQTAVGAVADGAQTAAGAVADAGQTVADGAQTAAGAVADGAQAAAGAVADAGQTAVDAVADVGGNVVESVGGFFGGLFGRRLRNRLA
ncbi:hypothetical protein HK102_008077, partial [Quaeritorhiza haematococci]